MTVKDYIERLQRSSLICVCLHLFLAIKPTNSKKARKFISLTTAYAMQSSGTSHHCPTEPTPVLCGKTFSSRNASSYTTRCTTSNKCISGEPPAPLPEKLTSLKWWTTASKHSNASCRSPTSRQNMLRPS